MTLRDSQLRSRRLPRSFERAPRSLTAPPATCSRKNSLSYQLVYLFSIVKFQHRAEILAQLSDDSKVAIPDPSLLVSRLISIFLASYIIHSGSFLVTSEV